MGVWRPRARVPRWLFVVLAVGYLWSVSLRAQQPAQPSPETPVPATPAPSPPSSGQPAPGQPAPPAPAPGEPPGAAAATPGLVFAADAGFVVFIVTAEGAADFEAFFAKLKQALQQGAKPEYAEMAAGWKLFRVADVAQAGQVLYASIIDPAVAGADYDPVQIVTEAFPAEAAVLVPKLKDVVLSVNRLGLDAVLSLGQ